MGFILNIQCILCFIIISRSLNSNMNVTNMSLDEVLLNFTNLMVGMAGCKDCKDAYDLLSRKEMSFSYLPKEKNDSLVQEIKQRYGDKVEGFPMIFIDRQFIGGWPALQKKYGKN